MPENIIEETIVSNIKDQDTYFVFPTQTAADLWADRTTLISGVTAVAMERFIAWDKFKSSSIRSRKQDKESIPSEMRKFFAVQLIAENAANPFLKNLITPEYAETASGFTNWISSLLPSLANWKKYFTQKQLSPDDEDQDLLELYNRYSTFLDKYNLFDPAWEYPPFEADGHKYFIFFPEILSDYFEYEKILNQAPEITTINFKDIPAEQIPQNIKAYFFNNGRLEIKNAVLMLKKLHFQNHIPWNEIAVNVPDMDSYGPYLERELKLYEIPAVTKNAMPLSSTCAGSLFSQILECVSQKFSFSSIRNLLLNTDLPWLEPKLNSQLIAFGQENNCVCGFNYNGKFRDPWEQSFEFFPHEERLKNYYTILKHTLTGLVNARTFKEIHTLYFKFRQNFFGQNYQPAADKIISRCLVKLTELMDLEKKYSECQIPSPYSFFAGELDDEKYLEQSDQNGVQILPYRMAATSPFKCHIVLDSSQSSLSVMFKQMGFLREDKRKLLFNEGFEDPNVTENFIRLYAMNSTEVPAIFTVSERTFTGYSQVSSYLIEENHKSDYVLQELEQYDSYKSEKDWYITGKNFPKQISAVQKSGFTNWNNFYDFDKTENSEKSKALLAERIKKTFFKDNKLIISCSQMKKFYQCPRIWLYSYAVKLGEQNNEADLMGPFDLGTINHKIFELYSDSLLKEKRQILINPETNGLYEEDTERLYGAIEQAIQAAHVSFLSKELIETSKPAITAKILDAVTYFSQVFNGCLIHGAEIDADCEISENVKFTGKIDCVVYDPSADEYIIVDYKTSATPDNLYYEEVSYEKNAEENSENAGGSKNAAAAENQEKSCLESDSIPDFQIPAYKFLLKNSKHKIDAENACFFSINKSEFKPVYGNLIFEKNGSKKSVSSEDFEPTVKFFSKAVNEYVQNVNNADIPVSDAKQKYSVCNSCDYRAVCRRVFQISRAKN